MYTDSMRRAFHSVEAPGDFFIELSDNDSFITIKLSEHSFINLSHDEKIKAVQYVAKVKSVLEQCGAIVLVTRDALK